MVPPRLERVNRINERQPKAIWKQKAMDIVEDHYAGLDGGFGEGHSQVVVVTHVVVVEVDQTLDGLFHRRHLEQRHFVIPGKKTRWFICPTVTSEFILFSDLKKPTQTCTYLSYTGSVSVAPWS